MSEVLNVESIAIRTDAGGRMDLNHLEEVLATGKIGTVVATLGTTGLGAVDPLADIIPLAKLYGVRVHVDTAYGGFFRLISDNHLDAEAARHYAAIAQSDSVVVDPHKHGLQPYGCGAVFFSDITLGRYYKHDSPYTYFASDDLHFGEIQLECSRAGASAAALWATLKVFPLNEAGLGQVLLAGRRAATNWYDLMADSDVLQAYQKPELDIIAYLPKADSMSRLDTLSHNLFLAAADRERDQQIHLATYVVKPEALAARGFEIRHDADKARIMRSVLMKPEQENWIGHLHTNLESITRTLIGNQ
jgi:glutamate/tyrosine decarboxylase-like PLP-dependent enzyme